MSRAIKYDAVAIVPVKQFEHAKTRLANYLTRLQRNELAIAMLHDTLRVLSATRAIKSVYVVTCDPLAEEIAKTYGAKIVYDRFEAGTNTAMVQGLEAARSQNCAAVMLPTDLPCLTPMNVRGVVNSLAKADCAIAPSNDGGTALLALRHVDSINTAFGPNSYELHLNAARKAKLSVIPIAIKHASHDLDTIDDLMQLKAFLPIGRARQVLALAS